ncbi:hypothetical protein [Pseudonocardia abyssalis]|uniref:DUF222 domain-containing protein n=1 Tax=Pseudonocardia abyssalis TaxID=2792008 RepID=A0ABS6UQG8_9PSEU|nr:hypothetical protein [Pseudonocardia abyssalis]MBW0117861.1 hypothetical protein [Pseudonocardia abyssalis]MBW0134460.1 hypothetical protein [Pseudonocardia abyssalis]
MTIVTCAGATATRAAACTGGCSVDPALRAHHDRLLTVEHDADEMIELMELAVTWGELEYDDQPLVGPDQWVEFAATHIWVDAERAERIFSLASDIAARSTARVRVAA